MATLKHYIHGNLEEVRFKCRPKHLLFFRTSGKTNIFDAHALVENFNQENGVHLKILSLTVARATAKYSTFRSIYNLGPVLLDTAIAYENIGAKLGKEIVFPSTSGGSSVVLATGRYRGERNIALVASGLSSTDFKKDGKFIVLDIPDSRLKAVPNFLNMSGPHPIHAKTGIPHGTSDARNPKSEYFSVSTSSFVGLLTYDGRLDATSRPYVKPIIVTEVPKADVAKIQALIIQALRSTVVEFGVSQREFFRLYAQARMVTDTLSLPQLGPIERFMELLESIF